MKKNLTDNEKIHFHYFIKCISSAVNNFEIPAPFENINWNYLLNLSSRCSLEAIFASVILSIADKYSLSKQLVSKLNTIKAQQIMIDSIIDYEIENLISAFDKNGIKNVPVKGYFLKKEYPRSDFRSVSDFDILFDIKQLDKMKTVFASLGYEFLHSDDNQYHFKKAPYMYIEMHSTLVHDYEISYPYLKDVLSFSEKRENYNYAYKLREEDHYLYLLIHHSNHFRIGGMGIRMMLDIYLFNKHHKADFDMEYIKEKLRFCKLEKFEELVIQLANNWFAVPNPRLSFDDFETYILLSCTLGRLDAAVLISSYKSSLNKENSKNSKIFYLLSNVFPSQKELQYTHPYAYNHKILLPVAWCSIWFKRFFIEKNVNIKRGIKNRMFYSDDDVRFVTKVFDYAGFNDLNIKL